MVRDAHWYPDGGRALRYTNVAIVFHWLIAAMIVFNLATGLFHDSMPRGTMPIHISSGITILALSLARILWRLTHRPPPYPADMKGWERALASIVHFSLYVAMIAMPLTGWLMISARPPAGSAGEAAAAAIPAPPPPASATALPPMNQPIPGAPPRRRGPTMLWGIVPLPLISPVQEMGRYPGGVAAQKEFHEMLETRHGQGGYILLFLLLLHIGGALKHQLIDRHRELARMGIGEPETLPAE